MRKSSLLLSGVVVAGLTPIAQSYDFTDKVYGKANATFGYTFQMVANSKIKDRIKQADDFGNGMNDNFHTINLGIGYDVYYKLNDTFHPFVGLDIEGRIPVYNDIFLKRTNGTKWAKGYWRIADFFSADLKFGSKVILNKDTSLQGYGLFGLNLIESSHRGIDADNVKAVDNVFTREVYVGLNAGGGIGAIYKINDKLSLIGAIEYKYTYVRDVKDENGLMAAVAGDEEWAKDSTFETYASHQVGIKLGVQFL